MLGNALKNASPIIKASYTPSWALNSLAFYHVQDEIEKRFGRLPPTHVENVLSTHPKFDGNL